MNRRIESLLVVCSLLFAVGCGGLKETFEYQTSSQAAGGARASCKTPLRVAVKPFVDARKATEAGTASFTLSMIAGAVVATPSKIEVGFDRAKLETRPIYVHDDRRLYAIVLWAELVESGCFAEVAFEPEDESQYDLVFSGEIQRFGLMRSTGFVPLPLYVGNLIAVAGMTQQTLVEVDVYAHRPGKEMPVLRYGLQGFCDDECSEDNLIDSVTKSLASGHADFIARLSSYLRSRGEVYWKQLSKQRRDERRHELDPELARLEKALRSEPAAVRESLAPAVERKRAALDALIDEEQTLERRWAATSRKRVHTEVIASNELVDAVFAGRMRAAVLGALLSAATSTALSASSGNSAADSLADGLKATHTDAPRYQQALLELGEKPSARASLDPETAREIESIRSARKSFEGQRTQKLSDYRRETGSAEDLIARARDAAIASDRPTGGEPTALLRR